MSLYCYSDVHYGMKSKIPPATIEWLIEHFDDMVRAVVSPDEFYKNVLVSNEETD